MFRAGAIAAGARDEHRSPLRPWLAVLLIAPAVLLAQTQQTFTGTITDSMCADANHSAMGLGPTDAECAAACADAHGATYVLYDGHAAFALSDQRVAAGFAGKKVTVMGALDAATHTIRVESIASVQ